MSDDIKARYNETFIAEAREQLSDIGDLLLNLEKEPDNTEILNELFRLMHTLKGTSAILGHTQISQVAHIVEDLFDALRAGKKTINKDLINLLFETVDLLEEMVKQIKQNEGITENPELLAKLHSVLEDSGASEEILEEHNADALKFTEMVEIFNEHEMRSVQTALDNTNVHLINIDFSKKCQLIEGRAFQILRELKNTCSVLKIYPEINELAEMENVHQVQFLVATEADVDKLKSMVNKIPDIEAVECEYIKHIPFKASKKKKIEVGETIRVNVKLLDSLLNLVGENMINNIQINQISSEFNHSGLNAALKKSNMLTEELQHYVLQMRMVPIDQIFRRFPRMVRDMSQEYGKDINFVMEGKEIEIDRSLLDEIGDSLVHLLRNSVDHGIEAPEHRKKKGKQEQAQIKLMAFSEQGSIVIKVTDDGRGIDLDKLVNKAISKNLLSKSEAEDMKDQDKMDLVFLPGVSTAEKISEVSGRGVGLDVVFNKIKSLGGRVDIKSELDVGTTVTIKLPPTMAIIRALLIKVNNDIYAIPLENVAETVNIEQDEIHNMNDMDMFKLREEIIPLINLNLLFSEEKSNKNRYSAVIVEKDSTRLGLIIDNFVGQQEIVVKNLGYQLQNSSYFSGATILGDGSVAMILDVSAFTK